MNFFRTSMFLMLMFCYGQSVYASDDLSSLLYQALSSNPEVDVVNARIESAAASVEIAKWDYWPTPSFGLRTQKNNSSNNDDVYATLNLNQPLWTFGRLDASLAKSIAGKTVAEKLKQETYRDLAFRVVSAWGSLCMGRRQLIVYDRGLERYDELLDQIRRRIAGGASSQSDLILVESRKSSLASRRSTMVNLIDRAYIALERLVDRQLNREGIDCSEHNEVTTAWKKNGEELFEQAKQIDPALQRLQAEIEQAQADLDYSKAELWPELKLNLQYNRGNDTGSNTAWSIDLEQNFGAGLSRSTAVSRAASDLSERRYQLNTRLLALKQEILEDQQNIEFNVRQEDLLRVVIETLEAVSDAWQRQFLAGKKSWLDIMNSVREEIQNQLELESAIMNKTILNWNLHIKINGTQSFLEKENNVKGMDFES